MREICIAIMFLGISLGCSCQILADKKINEIRDLVLLDSTINLLVEPAQVSEVRVGKIDSVYYEVLLDDSSRIKFISTGDIKFRSEDGIKVGDTFRFLAKKYNIKKSDVVKYPGWGYVLKLKSGWFAVFDFGKPIQSVSPVLFFYQRNQ